MSQQLDISTFTVKVLKMHLKNAGLKLGGKKAELKERLEEYVNNGGVIVELEAADSPTGKKAKSVKDPLESFTKGVRLMNQPLSIALNALLTVYGISYEQINDSMENLPISLPTPTTRPELKALKVAELKKILKDMGQKLNGKKDDLVDRILNPVDQTEVSLPIPELDLVPLPEPMVIPEVNHDLPSIPSIPNLPEVDVDLPVVSPVSLPAALPVAPVVESPVSLPTALPVAPVVESPVSLPAALPVVESPSPAALPVVESPSPAALSVAPVVESPVSVPAALPVVESPISVPAALPVVESHISLPAALPVSALPVSVPAALPVVESHISVPAALPVSALPVSVPVDSPEM